MSSQKSSNNGGSRRQAVVIGGSIAGLLASRILADHFEQVIVIERDRFTDNADPRKGAPQARHAHAVLAKAVEIIEELFPGFFAELEANGSTKIDMCDDLSFYHFGKWKKRFSGRIYSYFQNRTFLEWKLRQRVSTISNISFMDAADVTQFTTNDAKTRITGVQVQAKRDSENPIQQQVSADLVVDAGGRGSRTSQWLEALGYPKVEEMVLKVDIAYSTRFFQRTQPDPAAWKSLFIYPKLPDKRLGVILPTEDKTKWLVTLGGVFGDHPPTDDAGFLEYARSLPVPDLYNVIKDLEPAGPVLVHKLPSNLRRRYEHMARFPEGLVVLGDALCSFNPIYGQGMTTAALESLALDSCLREQQGSDLTGLSMRFQKRAAAVIANPWLMATAEDMRYDEFPDRVSAPIRFLHWFTGRVHSISDQDELSAFRFTQAMNMLRPPWALFDPRVVWRALTARSTST